MHFWSATTYDPFFLEWSTLATNKLYLPTEHHPREMTLSFISSDSQHWSWQIHVYTPIITASVLLTLDQITYAVKLFSSLLFNKVKYASFQSIHIYTEVHISYMTTITVLSIKKLPIQLAFLSFHFFFLSMEFNRKKIQWTKNKTNETNALYRATTASKSFYILMSHNFY